jgi:hypothetical protein
MANGPDAHAIIQNLDLLIRFLVDSPSETRVFRRRQTCTPGIP